MTVDLLAAVGSNHYVDPIARSPGGWVSQKAGRAGGWGIPGEGIGYTFVGATHNGLMLVVTALQTAGTGRFYTLHVLDAAPTRAFDEEGMPYDRFDLTILRNVPLGDRWRGDVKIDGDTVTITTPPGEPNNVDGEPKTSTFEARRP